jgi:alpha-1,3-glucosyltransferase
MGWFEPQSVELTVSRGYESPGSKLVMRWTVIVSDAAVFLPAVILFVHTYESKGLSDKVGRREASIS